MKKIQVLLSCILAAAAFTSCAPSSASQNSPAFSSPPAEPTTPASPEKPLDANAISEGANDFAFRFSAALLAQNQNRNENFICSPYSVWLPLAALVNGTDPQFQPQLLDLLGAGGQTEEQLNLAARQMLEDLTTSPYTEEEYNPLQIANALFVSHRETVKPSFSDTFAEYYQGKTITVDFASPDAVNTVNQWASQHTEGLIPEIVQQFDPQTAAAIANAIYYSDRWSWEFDPDKTKEDVFHAPSGDSTAHFMLREGNNQLYFEDDTVQAMPLSFKTGGGLYLLLPKNGDARALLSSMTSSYFSEIQSSSRFASGKLLLPRFAIQSDVLSLDDSLKTLGVPLFDAATGPLTGVVADAEPLWLSNAVQKAMISVDEKGTTAAAVTVMAMAGTAMPEPTPPFEMNCNRPFVFVLYGGRDNQILFTGVVNQP